MAATTHEEDVHVYMLTLCVRSNTCHQLVVFVIYIFFSKYITAYRWSARERKKEKICVHEARLLRMRVLKADTGRERRSTIFLLVYFLFE